MKIYYRLEKSRLFKTAAKEMKISIPELSAPNGENSINYLQKMFVIICLVKIICYSSGGNVPLIREIKTSCVKLNFWKHFFYECL